MSKQEFNYWDAELPKNHPMHAIEEGLCENLCTELDDDARRCDPDYDALQWLRRMYTLEAWIQKAPESVSDGMIFDTLKLVRVETEK